MWQQVIKMKFQSLMLGAARTTVGMAVAVKNTLILVSHIHICARQHRFDLVNESDAYSSIGSVDFESMSKQVETA